MGYCKEAEVGPEELLRLERAYPLFPGVLQFKRNPGYRPKTIRYDDRHLTKIVYRGTPEGNAGEFELWRDEAHQATPGCGDACLGDVAAFVTLSRCPC